jgi:hypothetical protein
MLGCWSCGIVQLIYGEDISYVPDPEANSLPEEAPPGADSVIFLQISVGLFLF